MELFRRIWYLLNRRRLQREMADEMAYHRELMPVDRQREFGNDLRLLERSREVWGWAWLDHLCQDLTYGSRVLRRSPGFTLTAVLVLSLGIGVPLTAFRQLLYDLRANGAPDPDTLVQLTRRGPGLHITVLSYPAFAFYASNARSFRDVIAISQPYQAVFGHTEASQAAEQIQVLFATANYFPEYGIPAARGRLLASADERLDTEPVALLGELFWQRRFGGDTSIVGQTIVVNGKPVRVVGVVPRSVKESAEVWMPLIRQPYVIEGSTLPNDWNSALEVYARLKSGVSPKTAEEETRSLALRLHALRPSDVEEGEYLEARPILQLDRNGNEFQIALTAAALVMILLVAACANLGTLVLARGVTREREIRTRMALGAGRKRVVRQLVTESLLLAGLSGACALVLSAVLLKVIQLQHNSGVAIGLFPGWSVLGSTAGMAVVAALVFGLPSALRLTSLVPGSGRFRTIFLGTQVAVSCLLLVVSSLLVSNIQRLRSADPGLDYNHLVWISPGLKAHGYSAQAAEAYLDMLRTRTSQIPGVRATSVVWLPPWGDSHAAEGWSGRQFATNHVDANFLNTMNLQLVRGRNFLPGEERVALVTEAAARLLWPDTDALGKALPWDLHRPTVIGVLRNVSTTEIGAVEPLEFYVPRTSTEAADSILVLHVSSEPRNLTSLFQAVATGIDRRLQPVVGSLADAHDRGLEKIYRPLGIIAMLGTVALLLSFIGLLGLASYTVAQRTKEIGLRMALGAGSTQIVRAILAPMTVPVGAGLLCGILGGSAVVRVLRSGIAGIVGLTVFDPWAYLGAMVFFTAVVALAVFAPARRAIRIDPSQALQHE
jgi:macrolide transport system ATP-binding/permease protein